MVLLEIAIGKKKIKSLVCWNRRRSDGPLWSIPKSSLELLTFWVIAPGAEPAAGAAQLCRSQRSPLTGTECLKYICDGKYLSGRPPALSPFKVTVIEGWRHAILTFIIRLRKRSASFWMWVGASGRGALRCHITFLIFSGML